MFTRRNILITALTLFLVYLLAGILVAPFVARKLILPKVQERLIPELTVAKIQTNPLLLSATLLGIDLKDANSGAYMKINKAHARLSFSTFWRLHPVIAEFELTKPELFATRDESGTLNWETLLVPTEPKLEQAPSSELPKATLQRLTIIDGNLEVIDTSPTRDFEQSLGPISFEVLNLSTVGTDAGTYSFNATTPEGATITWEGTLNPSEFSIDGALSVTDLALHRTSPYLIDLIGLELTSANMSMAINYRAQFGDQGLSVSLNDGTYHLNSTKVFQNETSEPVASIEDLWIHDISTSPLEMKAHIGFIELSGLEGHLKDTDQTSYARIAGLSIDEITLADGVVSIGSIDLENLGATSDQKTDTIASSLDAFSLTSLSFQIDGNKLEIASIVTSGSTTTLTRSKSVEGDEPLATAPSSTSDAAPPEVAEEAKSAPTPALYSFELGSFNWSEINLILNDQTVEPAADLRLNDILGSITGLSSAPEGRADLDLSATAMGDSPITVKGTFNPFPEALYTDFTLAIQAVDVTAFSSYAGQFLGRRLAQGGFTFDLTNKIENNQLSGSASILLDQLELGEKVDSPAAANLPLDLALMLFRDASGKITFNNVTISGDLSEPGFSYTGIIAQAFGNLITKAAAAPFRFLGNTLGSIAAGSEASNDTSRITFNPGSTVIPANQKSISTMVNFYAERPLLNFEIQGFYSEAERAELISTTFEEQLRSAWMSRPANIRESFVRERPRLIRRLAVEAEITTQDIEGNALPIEMIEPALLKTVTVEDTALLELASKRAIAVQERLIENGILPDDLHLLDPQATDHAEPYVHLGIRP